MKQQLSDLLFWQPEDIIRGLLGKKFPKNYKSEVYFWYAVTKDYQVVKVSRLKMFPMLYNAMMRNEIEGVNYVPEPDKKIISCFKEWLDNPERKDIIF